MLYAIIVIYNKKCEDSITIRKLQECTDTIKKEVKCLVFDNSTQHINNEAYCKKNGYLYMSVGKNIGISRAYNASIKYLSPLENDYIMILDDDTEITNEYFNEAFKIVELKKYDILLPVVISNGVVLSPSNLTKDKCRSKIVKTTKDIDAKRVTAINSGEVIRASLFKKIHYNENLFLDYVDHDFMREIHKINASIYIMKNNIVQHYSKNENANVNSAMKRFAIYCHDYKIFCEEIKKGYIFYIYSLKYIFQLTMKYKSGCFLKYFLSNITKGFNNA